MAKLKKLDNLNKNFIKISKNASNVNFSSNNYLIEIISKQFFNKNLQNPSLVFAHYFTFYLPIYPFPFCWPFGPRFLAPITNHPALFFARHFAKPPPPVSVPKTSIFAPVPLPPMAPNNYQFFKNFFFFLAITK